MNNPKTEQVNFRLPTDLIERFNKFFGFNKTRLGFKRPKDAAVLLLEMGLDVYEEEMKKRIKEKK
jgi:hypothetical protein